MLKGIFSRQTSHGACTNCAQRKFFHARLRKVRVLAVSSDSAFVGKRRVAVGTAHSRGFLFYSFLSRLLRTESFFSMVMDDARASDSHRNRCTLDMPWTPCKQMKSVGGAGVSVSGPSYGQRLLTLSSPLLCLYPLPRM